jgi:hypothetical protein
MTGDVRRTGKWMDAKQLLLVLLALTPGVSTSRTPGDPDRTEPFAAAHDGIGGPSCRDLRDAELILARHEVQLLDELASESARSEERETRKGELDDIRASVEDVDRALAAARCPPPSPGG